MCCGDWSGPPETLYFRGPWMGWLISTSIANVPRVKTSMNIATLTTIRVNS
jgi:hypothetical protein